MRFIRYWIVICVNTSKLKAKTVVVNQRKGATHNAKTYIRSWWRSYSFFSHGEKIYRLGYGVVNVMLKGLTLVSGGPPVFIYSILSSYFYIIAFLHFSTSCDLTMTLVFVMKVRDANIYLPQCKIIQMSTE